MPTIRARVGDSVEVSAAVVVDAEGAVGVDVAAAVEAKKETKNGCR